jgi:hypothetical protein
VVPEEQDVDAHHDRYQCEHDKHDRGPPFHRRIVPRAAGLTLAGADAPASVVAPPVSGR